MTWCLQIGPVKLGLFEVVLIVCILFILGCAWYFSDSKRRHHVKGLTKDALKEYNRLFSKKKKHKKHENVCRSILERLTGKSFPSIRPDWLKSPQTGRNLEIDCYNDELKIAVEVQGRQHYEYTPHFHRRGEIDFENQKKRDRWKKAKCEKLGITFIEIPYTMNKDKAEPFIREQLKKSGVNV